MTIRKDFDNLLETLEPELAKAFQDSIKDLSNNVLLKEMIAAIEIGDYEAAFKAVNFDKTAFRPLLASIEQAFETGGVTAAAAFPKRLFNGSGRTVYRFDVRNVRAEKWVKEHSGELITHINETTRVNVRNAMFDGLTEGRNPRSIALDIAGRVNPKTHIRENGLIGLNKPQERAVSNMRKDLLNLDKRYFTRTRRDKRLDPMVRRMFKSGGVDQSTITKITARYSGSLLKLRGDTIARDSALQALHRSEFEAIKQAEELGVIKTSGVKRIWDATENFKGGRTRDSHVDMEGQTVGLNEAFTFPSGGKAMFPQDRSLGAPAEETINCRCKIKTVIDWLDDLS